MYVDRFGMEAKSLCSLTATLRGANNCMLFNANNLLKTSFGNVEYGGITFVLNKQALHGRLFWESCNFTSNSVLLVIRASILTDCLWLQTTPG